MPSQVQAVGQTCPWDTRSIPREGDAPGGAHTRVGAWPPCQSRAVGAMGTGAVGTPDLTAPCPALPLPEHSAHLVLPDACATAWPEPGQGEQHPGHSSTTLRILASMPSRTIGRCCPTSHPSHGPGSTRESCPLCPALPQPPTLLPCFHPQGAAVGPSSPSTTTARPGCGAGAAAHPCSSSAAPRGPACGSTTWRPTPPGPH